MENNDKKTTPYLKRLADLEKKTEELEKKNAFDLNEGESIIALGLVAGLFGNFDIDAEIAKLEKRLEKLETKNEMLEKIVLK